VKKVDKFSGKFKRYGQKWDLTPTGVIFPSSKITDLSIRSKSNFLDIKNRAVEIENLYENSSIRLDARSGLGQLIKHAKELSDNWLLGNDDGFSYEIFFLSMHLDRIAVTILLLENVPDKIQFLKRLKSGSLNFFNRDKSEAKNTLWEIEVWAQLRKRINSVKLEEPPDIVVEFENSKIGISCKKVYSETHVQNVLSKAVKQIEKEYEFGIVAINIDDLLPPDVVLKMNSSDAVIGRLHVFNTDFINRHIRHFTKYFSQSRIISAIVSTAIIVDVPPERPRFRNTFQWTVWAVTEIPERHKIQLKRFYDLVMN